MKSTSISILLISLLLCFELVLVPTAALAAFVNYTPNQDGVTGTTSVKMPLLKLGSVEIPRGRVAITGNTIEITTIPEYQFDRQEILTGIVLRAQAILDDRQANIKGIAYFNDGSWLKYIDNEKMPDVISTDKESVTGKVMGLTDDGYLEFQEQGASSRKIPLTSITNIKSPRAYVFSLPAIGADKLQAGQAFTAEALSIDMKPSSSIYNLKALKTDLANQGDRDLSNGQITAITVFTSFLQLAQLAPLIIIPVSSNGLRKTAALEEYHAQTSSFTTSNTAPVNPNFGVGP